MASEERNALAELANELNRLSIVSGHCPANSEILGKASRIIAELAKVEFYWNGVEMWTMHDHEAVQALVNSRAIAEKGANNER